MVTFDLLSKRFEGRGTAQWWLETHSNRLRGYVRRIAKPHDWDSFEEYIYFGYPELGRKIVEDYWKDDEEKWETVIREFEKRNGQVWIIVGGRGSGKCVPGDTEIVTSDGSVVTIEEMVNDQKGDVLSLNNVLKVEQRAPSAYLDMGTSETFKITTRSGRTIEVTPEHPFLTIEGWKECRDLAVGERIAVPRVIPVFGNEEVPDYKIKVLAYLLGDGHVFYGKKETCRKDYKIKRGGTILQFANKNVQMIENFIESIKKFGNVRTHIQHNSNHVPLVNIGKKTRREKNPVIEWLKEIGFKDGLAHEKEIPAVVFRLSRQKLALFLNQLYACDGCMRSRIQGGKAYSEISYFSTSRRMARQVQHLLLRFGILSRLKVTHNERTHPLFRVDIREHIMIEQFLDEIGDFRGKEEELRKNCARIKRNFTADTVPQGAKATIRKLKKRNKKTWGDVGKLLRYRDPSWFCAVISRNCSIARETIHAIGEAWKCPEILKLADSDIFWDGIKEIEPSGVKRVYDLTVNPLHNFIANDFFVHNTVVAYLLMEEIQKRTHRKCYIAGPPQAMPSRFERIPNMADAPQGSCVFVDEASSKYFSRESMSPHSRETVKLLNVLRHSGRNVIFATQMLRSTDVLIRTAADVLVIKEQGIFAGDEEKKRVKSLLSFIKPHGVKETLFWFENFFTMVRDTPKPKCWRNIYSTPYTAITDEKLALETADEYAENMGVVNVVDIKRYLGLRSFVRPINWWKDKLLGPETEPTPPQEGGKEGVTVVS